MATQQASETTGGTPIKSGRDEPATEFPVREYIGAMSLELAQMARWDGDEALARSLESASSLAGESPSGSKSLRSGSPRAA